ncbi:MAG: sodium:calcium antiporter [Gammaproteobacteria bacterium]|jgi:cation:H+ antiporter
MITTWFYFLLCVATIGIAGVKLTHYGDAISDKTGIGGTWIGVLLLATVTSLPELATGISSVTLANVPNVAAGDVLGSCAYNLLILVLLDYLDRDNPLYVHAKRGHILAAGFGIVMLGFVCWNLVLALYGLQWSFWNIGLYSPLILLLYAIAMRTIFLYEKNHVAEFTDMEPDKYPDQSLRGLVLRYSIAAAFVVAAGIWLPYVATDIAEQMGWSHSFVGTMFAALVTSLPELVVTFTAVRIGAVDMAIGDLLGSNLFNILILTVDDIFYRSSDLLSSISSVHLLSAISAISMTGVVIVGMYYRSSRQLFNRFGWTSIALLIIYLANASLLYLHSSSGGDAELIGPDQSVNQHSPETDNLSISDSSS